MGICTGCIHDASDNDMYYCMFFGFMFEPKHSCKCYEGKVGEEDGGSQMDKDGN